MQCYCIPVASGKIKLTKGPYFKEAKRIKNEDELLKFYNEVKEGLKGTINGEILAESVLELSDLKIQKLRVSLIYEGEPCILLYLGFLLNQHKYSLQVLEFVSKHRKLGDNVSDLLIFSGDLHLKKQFIQ